MTADLLDRTYVITGANAGIGRTTALALACRGARVVLACRSAAKTDPVVAEIREAAGHDRVRFIELDLASLQSVATCAERLIVEEGPIHGLINNAGLTAAKGQTTADGFELSFGVNHLGHFALTLRLLERLTQSHARIVNVASKAHYDCKALDLNALRGPAQTVVGMAEYARSKLCNVLFTREAARRWADRGVTTYALHPGVVASEIWRRVPQPARWLMTRFMRSVEDGATTTLYCATDPALAEETGRYYDDCTERKPSALARDEALAAELWTRSCEWTGLVG